VTFYKRVADVVTLINADEVVLSTLLSAN